MNHASEKFQSSYELSQTNRSKGNGGNAMHKILVVDDDAKARKLLRDFLELKGYEVLTANGGKEALEKMKEAPAIVLLDIMMPDTHGLQVLNRIKEISPATGVIMVTSLAEHAIGVESLSRGAFDFVTKPIDLKHLEEVIATKILVDGSDDES
jgi:DNA-binding NtrC family response regulator